jgi:hypothetical protein
VAKDSNRQDDATGGARQFGRGDGSGERAAEQFNLDGSWGRGAVDQEGDGGAMFEMTDNFEKRKGILLNDEGLDAPARARGTAQFRQGGMRFFHGQGQELNAVPGKQGGAKFPVAEVRRDEKNTTPAFECREEDFATEQFPEEIIDGLPAFESKEIGEFHAELTKEGAGGGVSFSLVSLKDGQEIFIDDVISSGSKTSEQDGRVLAHETAERSRETADSG